MSMSMSMSLIDLHLVVVAALLGHPADRAPTAVPPAHATLAQAPMRGLPPPPPAAGMRGTPPPPPPVEHVEARRGFVWVEGNYEWRDGRYAWSGGHWEAERPGHRWHGGRWEWSGDRYVWVRGQWAEGPAYAPPPQLVIQTPPPSPPPPPVVAPPPPSRPGFVWIEGAQEWRDGRYVWVEGHWEKERHGHRWQSGHWDRDGDRHAWHPGGWSHDDGPNRYEDRHDDRHDERYQDRHDDRHDERYQDRHDDRREADRHDDERGRGPGSRGVISIVGRVLGPDGRPVPGIPVVLAGTSESRAVTDGGGNYAFTGLGHGSYAVRPNAPGCSFAPDVVNLNNLGTAAVQNFSTSCGVLTGNGGPGSGRR